MMYSMKAHGDTAATVFRADDDQTAMAMLAKYAYRRGPSVLVALEVIPVTDGVEWLTSSSRRLVAELSPLDGVHAQPTAPPVGRPKRRFYDYARQA